MPARQVGYEVTVLVELLDGGAQLVVGKVLDDLPRDSQHFFIGEFL